MGFLDFIKDIGSKVSQVWGPILGKVGGFVRQVAGKASDVLGGVNDAVQYASRLPVVGEAVRMLQNTPIGQGVMSVINSGQAISNALSDRPPPYRAEAPPPPYPG